MLGLLSSRKNTERLMSFDEVEQQPVKQVYRSLPKDQKQKTKKERPMGSVQLSNRPGSFIHTKFKGNADLLEQILTYEQDELMEQEKLEKLAIVEETSRPNQVARCIEESTEQRDQSEAVNLSAEAVVEARETAVENQIAVTSQSPVGKQAHASKILGSSSGSQVAEHVVVYGVSVSNLKTEKQDGIEKTALSLEQKEQMEKIKSAAEVKPVENNTVVESPKELPSNGRQYITSDTEDTKSLFASACMDNMTCGAFSLTAEKN